MHLADLILHDDLNVKNDLAWRRSLAFCSLETCTRQSDTHYCHAMGTYYRSDLNLSSSVLNKWWHEWNLWIER